MSSQSKSLKNVSDYVFEICIKCNKISGQFKEISLADYHGKYVVLFFYPLDFTFVCPTEIIAFSDAAARWDSGSSFCSFNYEATWKSLLARVVQLACYQLSDTLKRADQAISVNVPEVLNEQDVDGKVHGEHPPVEGVEFLQI